ncbi:uncharacterized protein LOC121405885 [Lytechinus variegatus]|uniref:uncharacterized protein LOC121405885 n=1 Tax=Lytechinus variegatus TaxID=7654 RepID=UPI001BB13828|nr:uncharacterized protein LOC121405885 [Lytechinus variegatus]
MNPDDDETNDGPFQTPPDTQSELLSQDGDRNSQYYCKKCKSPGDTKTMSRCSTKKCKAYFHFACTGMPAHMLTYIRRVNGAKYICDECEIADADIIRELCEQNEPNRNNEKHEQDVNDINQLKGAIENMEKEVIKCIRDIKFQTQNEGRCTCADENELKTTMDKQRDEIISLKECIKQLKSEINIRVNEYELLLKEQRLVVKSKEQELNMHKRYNENEEKKSNKLQSELDQTVEQLKMAKKEIDKVNEEKINIKRQWQASESDGEWWEQKRYTHTRGRKEGRDDRKWSEYRGNYHRGEGQWRERKRFTCDRREEERSPINTGGGLEQKRYSRYSDVAAPYRDADRPRNGQPRHAREISPQRNARNEGNERTTEGMNAIHEERNDHECDMSRDKHNMYDGSRGQMNDKTEKKMRKVVIVGNSQISGIDPDKFSQNVKLHKVIKYTMDDVESWLKSSEAKQTLSDAETVIIHELTNDVKRSSALDCACKMNNLIGLIKVSFKSIKIVISLGTPRDDNQLYQQRVDMANSMLMADALYDRRVKTVHHRNLLYRGTINTNLYSDDRYHLSKNGTRVIAGNLRWAIERSSSRNKR